MLKHYAVFYSKWKFVSDGTKEDQKGAASPLFLKVEPSSLAGEVERFIEAQAKAGADVNITNIVPLD